MKLSSVVLFASALSAAAAGIPSVGPDYAGPPAVEAPGQFKGDAGLAAKGGLAGAWWEGFGDPILNDLLARVDVDNHSLKAAQARVEQARARVKSAGSAFYPNLDVDYSATRNRSSAESGNAFPGTSLRRNNFDLPFQASYEVDLWGKVRRSVTAAQANVEAGSAAMEALRLSLRAEVARAYFTVRALDAERAALASAVEKRKEALGLTKSRLSAGTGNELDVERALTELATAETDTAAIGGARAEAENALASLTGQVASGFRLGAAKKEARLPRVPASLPGELMTRRPDVLEAERRLAAANEQIGVAKAAYFPSFRLTASGGWQAQEGDRLIDANSRTGAIGFSFHLPLFDGGSRKATVDGAKAAADEAARNYRQVVLQAFEEVENALASVKALDEQSAALERGLGSARKAAELSRSRYTNGLVSYFEVIEADRSVLSFERSAAQLQGRRFTAATSLVKALGGGWSGGTMAAPPEKGAAGNKQSK